MNVPIDSLKIWAKSMAGCDGGNPNAKVWLCGIEWGGGGKNDGAYYQTNLKPELESGLAPVCADIYDWRRQNSYRYGKSFSKLYTAYSGQPISKYFDYTNSLSGDEVFKLNLYPIAFDSTDESHWHGHGLDAITGFSHKHLFNLWCEHHRFPYFAELRSHYTPDLVVCCGLTYLDKLLRFFGANASEVAALRVEDIPCNSNSSSRNAPRRMYVTRLNGNTLFACIPFFSGSYGLNSDDMLTFVGKRLHELRGSRFHPSGATPLSSANDIKSSA
jgi:hypothetical protein